MIHHGLHGGTTVLVAKGPVDPDGYVLLLWERSFSPGSLLFGFTWVVNSVVFAGILTTVLLVLRATPVGALNALPTLVRGVLGGCLEDMLMWAGLRALVLIAGLFYALAMASLLARGDRGLVPDSETLPTS